mmetsp:Transcript_2168/g.5679  ORF Transcript_2168/g.5679 Transcript_2168/m.5679 type:complete len:157 (+) Transcript_2168:2022-2492(+)
MELDNGQMVRVSQPLDGCFVATSTSASPVEGVPSVVRCIYTHIQVSLSKASLGKRCDRPFCFNQQQNKSFQNNAPPRAALTQRKALGHWQPSTLCSLHLAPSSRRTASACPSLPRARLLEIISWGAGSIFRISKILRRFASMFRPAKGGTRSSRQE